MMVKGRFGRFDLGFVLFGVSFLVLLLNVGCSTSRVAGPKKSEGTKLGSPIQGELSSQEVVSGSIVVVTLHLSEDLRKKDIRGQFEETEFLFFPVPELGQDVYQSIFGVPYEHKPGETKISIFAKGDSAASLLELPFGVNEGDYPSEVLHVDGRRVNPTAKKDVARILKEQSEVAQIYRRVTAQKLWSGPFQLPIESRITSPFGTKRLYNGRLKNFHPGLDLKAAMNTPVHSAAPGIVVLAKNLFFTGNTVMLDHGYGVITLYAHMNEIQVKEGQVVKSHELLGLSGKTGRVNGPHLHWQAVVHRVKVNPLGLTQVVR